LSILCQLLAKKQQVKDAKIIIILSPGWFESKVSLGTSSTAFLEYNSERFLRNWVNDESDEANYARKRMAGFFPEINSPGLNLHAHFFQHIGTKSPLHYAAAMPFCELNKLMGIEKKDKNIFKNPPLNDLLLKPIAWDSLFNASAQETLANSSNNEFGINNDYFNSYIGNNRGNIQSVPLSLNTELSDFLALLKFIRKNNIDAAFVISPLNALYYKNLKKLDPVIDILVKEINGNGKEKSFPLLNLFNSNPSTYNKEILTDVMHLSNHGWYKVNKFILETYP
jgi:D-alanine transfer protein